MGFWGISFGLDYYHQNQQYLNFSTSGVINSFMPIIAPIDFGFGREWLSSAYFSISNNHQFKRWSFGYGLSMGMNSWDIRNGGFFDKNLSEKVSLNKSHWALGVVLPVYFQTKPSFYFGLIYRPTFMQFHPQTNYQYEHLISLDFAWKF